jgi:hypothetical protein
LAEVTRRVATGRDAPTRDSHSPRPRTNGEPNNAQP